MEDEPKNGEVYRHFKGEEYKVVCIARSIDDPQRKFVVYESLYESKNFSKGEIWARSLEEFLGFLERNGEKIKRFERVKC